MKMNINCHDRDRIFEAGSTEEWAELESHSANCAACAEEIRAWKLLSVAAQEMRDYTDSPALWHRIEAALIEESSRKLEVKKSSRWFSSWNFAPLGWRAALAGAFVLVLTISGSWLYFHGGLTTLAGHPSLLKSRALNEVERTESAYVQAIDRLAEEAKPQLENPATPLLSSYREKLLLIDNAIDDLHEQSGNNPSNAHLRYQLLSMYQEKQRTLEEVLEEKR